MLDNKIAMTFPLIILCPIFHMKCTPSSGLVVYVFGLILAEGTGFSLWFESFDCVKFNTHGDFS